MANKSTKSPKPKKPTAPQGVTEEGILLTPIDTRSLIGNLKLTPFEPPPFPASRPRHRKESPSRKSETMTSNETDDSPPIKRKAAKGRVKQFRQNGKAKQVLGKTDDRKLITPTTAFPNHAICKLIVTFPYSPTGLAFVGTGSLIGRRHVLTAGHVIFSALWGGWAKTILVVPGMDGSNSWFGSELLVAPNFKRRSVTGWTEDADIDYDWGLITLNSGFPLLGTFGVLYPSDDTLDNITAYITGYPTGLGTPKGTQQFGVPGGGKIGDYDSTLVYYTIDTTKGQSGSGVYVFWKGKRAIMAVHAGTYDDDENRGTRITKTRYNMIRGWQSKDLGVL
jgi:V8-like Glu-specific endopeptidase